MQILIGSARIDERGSLTGGKAGDQKQSSSPDYKGEVSQQSFYMHKKGWVVLRAKESSVANKIAENMRIACNNPNIGYDQNNRLDIFNHGVRSTVKTECDCSSLVRACVQEATGKKIANFNTSTEASVLVGAGFERIAYSAGMKLYDGDILVTAVKGHTVIVTQGYTRGNAVTLKPITEKKEVPDMPMIKFGSEGKAVKIWQVIIDVTPDGCFGGKTQAATKNWQQRHGLEVDGVVGPKTWTAALKEL